MNSKDILNLMDETIRIIEPFKTVAFQGLTQTVFPSEDAVGPNPIVVTTIFKVPPMKKAEFGWGKNYVINTELSKENYLWDRNRDFLIKDTKRQQCDDILVRFIKDFYGIKPQIIDGVISLPSL